MENLEFNILIGNIIESDKDLFFGPLREWDTFQTVEDQNLAKLLASLGLFSSGGQARKAGWDKAIPEGFSDFIVGKLKTRITILKITKERED